MVLRLHVLGPAFGLASIDAECLATITYLAYAVPQTEYELVATSPSGVPTHALPALQDTTAGSWTTGFSSIVAHLIQADASWNLDAQLTPVQHADGTAYTTALASTAAPLLALNLYVSSANWAATTRPAYSAILPFPLTWTEPPAIRRRMCDVAAHLGLSDLNIDDQPPEAKQQQATAAASEDARGFLKVPERLRKLNRGVRAALSPEHAALFRLEAAATECLAVLADLQGRQQQQHRRLPDEQDQDQDQGPGQGQGHGRFFFLGSQRPTTLDCLAYGYLSLMLVPEVPRPWLRDMMRRRYDCLCVFVDAVRDDVFGGDVASLPWVAAEADRWSEPWRRVTRFARGVVAAAVPDDWLIAGAEETTRSDDGGEGGSKNKNNNKPWAVKQRSPGMVALAALGNAVAGLGLVGSVLLYRHLSPFGSTFYRWEMQRRSLGPTGAFFGV